MQKGIKMIIFFEWSWVKVWNLCQGGEFWSLHRTYCGNTIINGPDKIYSLGEAAWGSAECEGWMVLCLQVTGCKSLTKSNKQIYSRLGTTQERRNVLKNSRFLTIYFSIYKR